MKPNFNHKPSTSFSTSNSIQFPEGSPSSAALSLLKVNSLFAFQFSRSFSLLGPIVSLLVKHPFTIYASKNSLIVRLGAT